MERIVVECIICGREVPLEYAIRTEDPDEYLCPKCYGKGF